MSDGVGGAGAAGEAQDSVTAVCFRLTWIIMQVT